MEQNEAVKTIYLVRHGHVQLPDEQKRYLGQTDVPLSEQGIRQAQWLQQYFASKSVAAVYHSPLQRCKATADILANKKMFCFAVTDLQEISMGSWEMLPMEQIRANQPEVYRLRGAQIDTFCPPNGESFQQCQKRSVAALQKILTEQEPGTSVVLVAHAGVNRCLISWIQNQPLKELLTITQPYACVTEVTEDNGSWRLTGTAVYPG